MIKGDRGAVELTDSPVALQRWMVAVPEMARALRECGRTYDLGTPDANRHHDQLPSVQKAFAKDIKSLRDVIEEMGNPFCEDSADILVLDTKEIVCCRSCFRSQGERTVNV